MKIEHLQINKLKPYEKNARIHPKKQVDLLAKNIKKFGFTTPILIDENNSIIAGHGRLLALKQLNKDEAPCVRIEGLTEEEIKALRLADNQIAQMGETDLNLVIEELKGLSEEMVELTGFDKSIMDVLEDDFDAGKVYETIFEPKTKRGDLYELGTHRLLCGDSEKEEDVAKVMNGEKADMVFTDPPYNVNYNYAVKYQKIHKARKKMFLDGGKIFNDKKTDKDFYSFLINVFKNCYKFSKDEMAMYVCHATKSQEQFFSALKDTGFHFSQTIIWLKERIILALGQDYHRVYEPVWFGWKEKKKHYKNKKMMTEKELWDLDRKDFEERLDVWHLHRDKSSDYIHPTQKPVKLPERAIKKNSQVGGGIIRTIQRLIFHNDGVSAIRQKMLCIRA